MSPDPPSIDPARLEALATDDWALLLAIAKRLAGRLDDDPDPGLELLRSTPSARLVSGRGRARAATLLSAPAVWGRLAPQLRAEAGDAPALKALLTGADGPDVGSGAGPPPDAASDRTRDAERRRRQRQLIEERDGWRRRAEGAEVRLAAIQEELQDAHDRLRAQDEELAALRARSGQASMDREQAVARERRRRDVEVTRLQDELAGLRRALEEARATARRSSATAPSSTASPGASRTAADGGSPASTGRRRRRDPAAPDRLVPGRPSRLPADVAPGTTQAARALLHRGRRVLVDGYNVTKQHQGGLDLERQRAWLVQQLAALVARRGIDPVVIFDGERSGGARAPSARAVRVRFTDEGITADDEIVFAVEATDDPVVVVTDDGELVARVAALGADVVGTRSFLGVLQ